MLLKQPMRQEAPIPIVEPRPLNAIKLTPEEEMAIAHPYLHGTALDRLEEEPIGPVPIDVYDDDIGDDLLNGINDIDAARQLITDSRQ
jgi:hypothetical protein